MDLNMPVMGGLEAARRLRILQASNCISYFPIMIVTAGSQLTKTEATENKIDRCLLKPIGKNLLKIALEEIWNMRII